MRARILDQPTLSGDYEEHKFDACGPCIWVLFQPDDEEDWVGVFGRSGLGQDDTAISETGKTVCVLAGGVAYVVSTSDRRLLYKSTQEQLQAVVSVPGQELFIAADFIKLHAYGPSGLQWSSGRISLDGIRFGVVNTSEVDGEVWAMDQWVPFRLKFEDWDYSCAWLCPY